MDTSLTSPHHPLAVSPSSLGSQLSLIVRHFPSWLTREEKKSLLQYFGAKDIVVMGTRGKMKNCAIITFASESEAKWALSKLHQLNVFGHRLSVEYTQPAHSKHTEEEDTDSWSCNKSRLPESEDTITEEAQEFRPRLKADPPKYLYPLPTPTTLTNITNALACVPQLYVQVLHLMNRLNLPPPFGDPTPAHPLLLQSGDPEELADYRRVSEEEGSELSSDEESATKKARLTHVPRHAPKRRAISYQQVKSLLPSVKKRRIEEEEETVVTQTKKIELNIPSEILPHPEAQVHTVTYITETEKSTSKDLPSPANTPQLDSTPQTASQFDVQPETETGAVRPEDKEKPNEQFISSKELIQNRLSEKERQEYSVFKRYSTGESSMRLYIKNLGKHVEEKDLRFIYGRYVDWSSEKESNAFDIRLMQTGRMKGQAFIGLPSEEVATRALAETNGYMLQDKPMVVQFGRSTKAKETIQL